jgi:molecular chaperone Hsp33
MAQARALGADNIILPFRVEALDTRGRVVRLANVLDGILTRHAYPTLVQRLLAEAITLTVLMGSSLKIDGRFQLQTRTDGAVDMLVVDFTPSEAEADIRAYARFDAARLEGAKPADLLGKGHLAFTVEQHTLQTRYQGIVALDGFAARGSGLEAAALHYFQQSEQIPTALRLAVAQESVPGEGGTVTHWRAGGILTQFLPQAAERVRVADLDPGDAPEGTLRHDVQEDDAWVEARARVESTQDIELIDPEVGADRLLTRLFNEHDVRVSNPLVVRDQCRCSEPRIRETLAQFSAEEMADMIEPDGLVSVTCEFCARQYRLAL